MHLVRPRNMSETGGRRGTERLAAVPTYARYRPPGEPGLPGPDRSSTTIGAHPGAIEQSTGVRKKSVRSLTHLMSRR